MFHYEKNISSCLSFHFYVLRVNKGKGEFFSDENVFVLVTIFVLT